MTRYVHIENDATLKACEHVDLAFQHMRQAERVARDKGMGERAKVLDVHIKLLADLYHGTANDEDNHDRNVGH